MTESILFLRLVSVVMITFASRVFRIIIQPFTSCLFLDAVSWGCAHPAVRLCLPYATATRPLSPWDRLGLLLCDGIDSFSWIRLRCCDYSCVTRVRVLFTFLATSLR